jgi:murein DD-endopeptidase MepM/ murein hydrolase activator NlpD
VDTSALDVADGVEFRATNHCELPQLLSFNLVEAENLELPGSREFQRVLSPRATVTLLRARRIDPKQGLRYRWEYRTWVGDPGSTHRGSTVYAIPFGGSESHRLGQGPDGAFSHRGVYAYDFQVPEGTPVIAARAGIVCFVRDGSKRGGPDRRLLDEANSVVVFHDDGTFAAYTHLRPNVVARVGQRVRVGELLGWSGSTGFTQGPHLHFEVWRRAAGGGRKTLPVKFRNGERTVEGREGTVFLPTTGRS